MGNLGHWYHLFPFIFIYFYLFFIISFSMKMISSVREKYDRCIIFYFLIMARRDTLHPHVLYRWVFVLCTQVPLGHDMMAKIEWYAIIMHSGTFASVYYWFYQCLLLFYLCIHFQYFLLVNQGTIVEFIWKLPLFVRKICYTHIIDYTS